jgi:hypothetical protein
MIATITATGAASVATILFGDGKVLFVRLATKTPVEKRRLPSFAQMLK